TVRIAVIFAVLAALASIIPYLWWGIWYLYGILAVDCVIVASTLLALHCTTPDCVKASGSTTLLKLGMFASLIVFLLSAVFL
ncbi:MAG: digeranylgeranylglyceryl phosphate synthase, partial [Methanoregula sp.]|nr:digeranylgeranylglyceryl phosphate synthase [Methanoregula sp.]